MGVPRYLGRFAPSPTGPLHEGSLVAALASWLDARAHGGQWLVRIEDVDTPRCVPDMDGTILQQLASLGLLPDDVPLWQSRRHAAYQAALDGLAACGLAYACTCSRKDVAAALQARGVVPQRHGELVYPGTCRGRQDAPSGPTAWRFRTDLQNGLQGDIAWQNMPNPLMEPSQSAITSIANGWVAWYDRRLGPQRQQVEAAVGDFPLKRADGCFTYQLAVVVDDAFQGITHVVRGEDLADNTARQILLQRALGLPTPAYLHTPLMLGANGEKLSKQNGAAPLDLTQPAALLCSAAERLGLQSHGAAAAATAGLATGGLLSAWVQEWCALYNPAGERSLP